ncbi:VOC family protein [Variovorax paradoxus]|nr:VOC family protein [Variovorax paradoxus]
MLKQPRFVIAVQDLACSAAYYRDVLGFSIGWNDVPGWRLYTRDACTIMAGECPDVPSARELGEHSYMAYVEVQDLNGLHVELAARGVQVVKALRTENWGMREFGIETVDGHRVMFGEEVSSGD